MTREMAELASLLARKRWSLQRLEELQRVRLRRLVHHAYESVPYYRRLMDRAGVRPDEIREPKDLCKLPVTTKADLRRAGPDCLAGSAGGLVVAHTSGHSGEPFAVYVTTAESRTRRLREFRMLMGAGVRPWDRLVLLGPTCTIPSRLHRRLGIYRMEVIPLTLPDEEQLSRLRASRPDVLWVFPTVLKTALYKAGCSLGEIARPRLLITSAQVMESPLRERLRREVPNMEITNIYGSAEVGRIAAECRARRGLHLEEDALILELLRDGQAVEPGEEGVSVLTCLDQLAMPFIRYEQGDLCRLKPGPCDCGRATRLMEPPLGRDCDMIALPDGGRISCARLDVAFRNDLELLQYRFIQHRRDFIEAQLCFREVPPRARLGELRRRMEEAVGHGIQFDVRIIPEMRFEGVKFKVFVSRIDPDSPVSSE
jgi:phenylacetate-CoA ligase